MALNDKQKAFADEYLITLNQTEAAKRAGYSPQSAKHTGSDLMQNPEVREYIAKRMEEKDKERVASQDEVLEYLTNVMRGKSESSVLAMRLDGSQGTIDKLPDEKERLRAAELLGKTYGLYTDSMKVSGAVPVVIAGAEALED